ncbi:hypothetical protein ACFO5O_08110 [Geojedonia litorea]|uniref:Uncharacterized protein n=1 Tax=Geojedonia litorea TaxID=1268269 RepID=A0ABV9N1W7_9FLAO
MLRQKRNCCSLKPENFQSIIDGKTVRIYFLKNANITMAVTNYGGRMVSLCTPDKNGKIGDIVLGFKSIKEYIEAKEPYHGTIIGRVANRIAKGQFSLESNTYELPINNDTFMEVLKDFITKFGA